MGFSVLMSVYKKEQAGYLSEAMESVFNQSLVPDEVVLMEDGPLTDELEQTISELKKRHFRLLRMCSLGVHLQRVWNCARTSSLQEWTQMI